MISVGEDIEMYETEGRPYVVEFVAYPILDPICSGRKAEITLEEIPPGQNYRRDIGFIQFAYRRVGCI